MRWKHALAGLASLAIVAAGTAAAQEPADLYGVWEATLGSDTITLELRPDGSGSGQEGDRVHPLRWRLDTVMQPAQLHFTIDGEQMVSLVRVDGPGRLTITEPDDRVAESFEDGGTLTFRRVADIAAEAEEEQDAQDESAAAAAEAGIPTHPDIYARLGLDISTPQTVVPAFIEAVETYDGLTVYFLLDPGAREFVWRSLVMAMDLQSLLGDVADAEGREGTLRVMREVFTHIGEETTRPGVQTSIAEPFPLLVAIFRYAAEGGLRPVPLPANPVPVFPPQFRFIGQGRTIADVTVEGDGPPAVIHLLASASGRWRVLGVTGAGPDEPHTWVLSEPR